MIRPISRALLACIALFAVACDANQITGPASAARGSETPRSASGAGMGLEVYIHAHADDWQLFMGNRVNDAVQAGSRVVLVYATAGDAGRDEAYWLMREAGTKASVDTITGGGTWSCAARTIRTHPIWRCVKLQTVSYFMRLPDGNGSTGTGYGYGSLGLLRDQGTPTNALDGSTTYASWSDFYATLAGIVDAEASDPAITSVAVHGPDDDRTINPRDHPDHWAVGDAVRAAAPLRGWTVSWYLDYRTKYLAVNLSSADIEVKRREFFAYDQTMKNAGYESYATDVSYLAWLQRTYSRTQQIAQTAPTAPTSLVATAASATEIDLSWTDAALNETEYRVHRSATAGFTPTASNQIATLSTDVATYTDNAVVGATTYYYRVVAANAAGSATSGEAIATTPTPTAQTPASPSNLAGITISSSQIDLSWTDNASNETGFRVERAPDVGGVAGTYSAIAALGPDASSYSDNGLTSGTTYWYRVFAYNGDGDSGPSNAISATTVAVTSPPSGLSVLGTTTGSKGKGSFRAKLTWTTGSGATVDIWRNGGRIISGATNTGTYTESLGNKRGTYTYQVCRAGLTASADCTNTASVTF